MKNYSNPAHYENRLKWSFGSLKLIHYPSGEAAPLDLNDSTTDDDQLHMHSTMITCLSN